MAEEEIHMAEMLKIRMRKDKETKGTIRYAEVVPPGEESKVPVIYIKREAVVPATTQEIELTVTAIS